MLSRNILLALSALVSVVAAQTSPNQANHFNYTVDLSKVTETQKAEWCRGERSVCDSLCGAPQVPPTKNECTVATLVYTCTCTNGTAPGLEYYSNSLPTFLCQEAFKQCNEANVGNANGQSGCRNNIQAKCGTLDAATAQTPTTTTGGTSSTPTPTAQQSGTTPSPSTTNSGSGAAATQVPQFAGVAVAAVLFGAVAQVPLW